MVNSVENARQRARQVYERYHYDGTFTVSTYGKVKDPTAGITSMKEHAVPELTDKPCHLSLETLSAAIQTESSASVTQVTKLFASPDLAIPAGSKITVTQAGKTTAYTYSGVPAVYDTHQEIILNLFEKWA